MSGRSCSKSFGGVATPAIPPRSAPDTVRKWRDAAYEQFEMVDDINIGLAKWTNLELSKELDLVIGYIEPGHGTKGKKTMHGSMVTAISLICISCTREEGDHVMVPHYCSF